MKLGDLVKPLVWVTSEDKGVVYHKAAGFCAHAVYDRFNTGNKWVLHWPNYTSRVWTKALEDAKAAADDYHRARVVERLDVGKMQAMIDHSVDKALDAWEVKLRHEANRITERISKMGGCTVQLFPSELGEASGYNGAATMLRYRKNAADLVERVKGETK